MADEYDRILLKAEVSGIGSLTKPEVEALKRLLKEGSARGNKARKLVNG